MSVDLPLKTSAAQQASKRLSPEAERALAEAAVRRVDIDARVAEMPPEHAAKRDREPVRYGDWESKGLACDF